MKKLCASAAVRAVDGTSRPVNSPAALLYRTSRVFSWTVTLCAVICARVFPTAVDSVLIAAAVLLGIAHAAADYDIPRALGRQRAVAVTGILAVYIAALGAAFVAFIHWPILFFAAFLILSWWHFGNGDARYEADSPLGPHLPRDWMVRGAVPLLFGAVPLPFATALILLCLLVCGLIADGSLRGRTLRQGIDVGLPAIICTASPYITGFLIYFAFWHAPRHIVRILALYIERTEAATAGDAGIWFGSRSIPTLASCLAIGAAIVALHVPLTPTEIVAAIFAVTVPHEWIVWFMNRRPAAIARRPPVHSM